jgi:hypothetical protein
MKERSLLPTFRPLDWHNRFLRNWELKISNLYYIHYVKNSFHYPLPITHYHALRSVTLQGKNVGSYLKPVLLRLRDRTSCTILCKPKVRPKLKLPRHSSYLVAFKGITLSFSYRERPGVPGVVR